MCLKQEVFVTGVFPSSHPWPRCSWCDDALTRTLQDELLHACSVAWPSPLINIAKLSFCLKPESSLMGLGSVEQIHVSRLVLPLCGLIVHFYCCLSTFLSLWASASKANQLNNTPCLVLSPNFILPDKSSSPSDLFSMLTCFQNYTWCMWNFWITSQRN